MVNRYIYFFLIPMPIFTFWCFWTFVLLSPPWLLSFWILVQAPLSIVSFCVRDILILTHGRRRTLAILFTVMWFSMCFGTYLLLGIFWLLLAFWLSFVAWDDLNIIQLFTLLSFHGSFVVILLGQSLVWSEWSLKIVL